MRRVKQSIIAVVGVLIGFLAFWVAAVRAVPGVRRRKAAARAARGA